MAVVNPFVKVEDKTAGDVYNPFRRVPDRAEQSPGDQARAIIANRSNDGAQEQTGRPVSAFPQKPQSLGAKIGDFFTGGSRETRASELPEFGSSMSAREFLGDDAGTFEKLLAQVATDTSFDEAEIVDILSKSSKNIGVQSDEAGNIIITNGEKRAILNRPGLSAADLRKGLGQAAMFASPAMRFTRPAAVGLGEAGVQAGAELAQSAAGGEFDPVEVVLAGAGGAAFQKFGLVLANKYPSYFNGTKPVDDKTRQAIRLEAIRLGFDEKTLTDDALDGLVNRARTSVKPEAAMAIEGEREFRIPLTQGTRNMDDAAMSFEDLARSGGYGDKPKAVMLDFERNVQTPAINAAVERTRTGIGGPGTVNKRETGEIVAEAITGAEKAAKSVVDEAYDPANIGAAELSLDGMNSLLNATRKAVIGIDKDRSLPETAKLLDVLKRTQGVLNTVKSAKDIPWQQIEFLRRRIGTAIESAEKADKRQLTMMKKAFDNYIDDAVIKGLFSGDAGAIGNLKEARSIFREYAKLFRSSGASDQAGKFVEKIVDANPTGEEVVNMLFGASNLNKTAGVNLVRRLRDIAGEDSAAWGSVREEVFRRLVKTTNHNGNQIISGSQSITALQNALKNNDTLMRELFKPEEIAQIQRLFAQVKRTQPDFEKSRQNPSGSGVVLMRQLTRVAGMLGGGFAMDIVAGGVSIGATATKTGKARNAVRPFAEVRRSLPRSAVVGSFTGAGVVGGSEVVGRVRDVQSDEENQ